jgi:hypothetical protein
MGCRRRRTDVVTGKESGMSYQKVNSEWKEQGRGGLARCADRWRGRLSGRAQSRSHQDGHTAGFLKEVLERRPLKGKGARQAAE